jgi:hypothetical protein
VCCVHHFAPDEEGGRAGGRVACPMRLWPAYISATRRRGSMGPPLRGAWHGTLCDASHPTVRNTAIPHGNYRAAMIPAPARVYPPRNAPLPLPWSHP